MIIKTQKCNRCGDVRPLSKFEVHPQAASGYRRTCKDCVSLYSKKTGPKPERMNIPADKRDPLAYHPNHSATYVAILPQDHWWIVCATQSRVNAKQNIALERKHILGREACLHTGDWQQENQVKRGVEIEEEKQVQAARRAA